MATQDIQVTGLRHQDPQIRLYVMAVVALARQLIDEDQASRPDQPLDNKTSEGRDD